MELIISEQNGWKKPIKIQKAITRLGSAPSNDIQLNDPQIAPTHLQLYYLADDPSNCKIINLGNAVVVRMGDQQQIVSSLETLQIQNGSEIELGPYHIQFILPLSATTLQQTTSIQASLRFPEPTLLPNQSATGWLTINNTGLQSSCQVDIALSGLPANCMQVDPAPLLYAGGQEDVRIQLFHRQLYPAAGFQNLIIEVTSCDSYPGEQVVINQGIYVSPVFEQSLEIIDDLSIEHPTQKIVEPAITGMGPGLQNSSPPGLHTVRSIPQSPLEQAPLLSPISNIELPEDNHMPEALDAESNARMQLQEAVLEVSSVPAGPSDLEPPKLKVVRNSSDDFWEKE